MDASQEKMYAFDFDGTLTERDTFIEFLLFVRGRKTLFLCLLKYFFHLLGAFLGFIPRSKVKQAIFSHYFRGTTIEEFNLLCQSFANGNWRILRPVGINLIREALSQGEKVVVISASIENWVRAFFKDIEGVIVIATQVEIKDGRLSGKFLTKNCNKKEKVSRLKDMFPDRDKYYIIAYGDSQGDVELLDFANEGYYKKLK